MKDKGVATKSCKTLKNFGAMGRIFLSNCRFSFFVLAANLCFTSSLSAKLCFQDRQKQQRPYANGEDTAGRVENLCFQIGKIMGEVTDNAVVQAAIVTAATQYDEASLPLANKP